MHQSLFRLKDVIKHKVHERTKGKPEVIIIGETHNNLEFQDAESNVIRKYKPEYVLSEAYDNSDENDTQKLLDMCDVSTLEKMLKHYDLDSKKYGVDKNLIHKLKQTRDSKLSKCEEINRPNIYEKIKLKYSNSKRNPTNRKSIMKTPFYEMDYFAVDDICGSVVKKLDVDYNKNPDDSKSYDLASMISEVAFYFKQQIKEKGENRVLNSINDVGAKLIGCDIDKSEIMDDLHKEVGNGGHKDDSYSYKADVLRKYVGENNERRENQMGQRIVDYIQKRKTGHPIVAIVGVDHTDEKSKIYEVLDRNGINYRVIKLNLNPKNYAIEEVKYVVAFGG